MDAQMFLEGRADGSWLVHWRLAGVSSSGKVDCCKDIHGARILLLLCCCCCKDTIGSKDHVCLLQGQLVVQSFHTNNGCASESLLLVSVATVYTMLNVLSGSLDSLHKCLAMQCMVSHFTALCGVLCWPFLCISGTPWPQDGPSADAAWSCSINANLPRQQQTSLPAAAAAASSGSKGSIPTGSVKLRLEVSTNIPPGFGTAICWENPLLPSNGLLGAAVDGGHEGIIDCLREGCEHDKGVGDEPGVLQEQQDSEQAAVMAADAAAMGGGSAATRWRGGGHGVLISALQKSVRRGMPTAVTR